MNAPFRIAVEATMGLYARARLVDLAEPEEARRLEGFVAAQPQGTPFHRPLWLAAVARGTGNRAAALVLEQGGELIGYLPLSEIHSPIFGRLLASTGFAVGGGVLLAEGADPAPLFAAVEELAQRRSCPSVELRGGALPEERAGWAIKRDSHCGFIRPLAKDDEAELLAIPRKQRAEVRRSLTFPLTVSVGQGKPERDAHYAVYAESVRNLGTPVFPRRLFEAVMDGFGEDADILTVWHEGKPVSSVLSLYHAGAVMPYWGGGTWEARKLRANDRMYYELMLHARAKGCVAYDFGRSKTGSGAYDFKRNWGFVPEPLSYATWTAPGAEKRDADPTSAAHSRSIDIWRRLPLAVANRLGPWIARGLG
jgi:FemAB-related protein (PEP-CTERM system-associated)